MSELKETKTPELDRCLNAIYLELPEAVAKDVNRIVREALDRARTEATADAYARAADVCFQHQTNQARHDERWLAEQSRQDAVAILALSPIPDYASRIRREALEETRQAIIAACPLADPNSTHPITIEGESCYGCEPFLAALKGESK